MPRSARKGKTVSLVLGSGGARGLAHIGVIECLTAHGYQIRSIAGSSMGALIGGIYAAGELDAYKHWVTALSKTDVFRLLDLSFGWSGLFKGERIIDKLRDLIGDRNIEDLSISFTAVSTDVEHEKEVWLSKGPLFDAIRASIAIPMVFTPVEIDGVRLVDGGVINPVPIAPTLRDRTDLTIAVNVNGMPAEDESVGAAAVSVADSDEQVEHASYHKRIAAFIRDLTENLKDPTPESWDMFDVMARSLDTMQNTIARLKLAAYNPDLTISIPRDAASLFEFYRARELIDLGRRMAEQLIVPRSQNTTGD